MPAAAYFLPGQWRAPLQYVLCVVYRSGSFDVVVVGLSYTVRSVAGDNAEILACSPLSVPTTYSSSSPTKQLCGLLFRTSSIPTIA